MPGRVGQRAVARTMFLPCAVGLSVTLAAAVGCGEMAESQRSRPAQPAPPREQEAVQASTGTEPLVSAPAATATAEPYGKSDAARMEDVHAIVGAIEEYRRRTGRLPFDETFASAPDGGSVLSINVNLSAEPLAEEFRQPPPGTTGSVLTTEEFIEYMRKVMGAGFSLPTDPAPAPRFYQVHFADGEYFVSAALFEPNEHTLPMADDWHKYQIGTKPDAAAKVRAVDEIEPR